MSVNAHAAGVHPAHLAIFTRIDRVPDLMKELDEPRFQALHKVAEISVAGSGNDRQFDYHVKPSRQPKFVQHHTENPRTLFDEWDREKRVRGTRRIIVIDRDVHPEVVSEFEQNRLASLRSHPNSPLPYYILPWSAFLSPRGQTAPSAIGENEFKPVIDEIQRLGTAGPILLEGETGTGKTRMARLLHETVFNRSGKPFFETNCAALDQSEARLSTFFRGVHKGVYSSVEEAESVFCDNDGGTILLDEFQELPTQIQATLLDLLSPFSTFVSGHKVGDNKKRWEADVQVLVAINNSLRELLKEGKLRPDIHFRLWRRVKLETLRSRLQQMYSDSSRSAEIYLRYKLLRMQEVGLRLVVNDEDGEAMVDRLRSAFGFVRSDETGELIPVRHRGPSLDMPLPEELFSYAWPGNFRELESLAHLLMQDPNLSANRIVGMWEMEIARRRFTDYIAQHSTYDFQHGSSATGVQESQQTPARYIALAWLAAVSRESASLAEVARELGLDPRTFRSRLEAICDNVGTPKKKTQFLAALEPNERESLVQLASRLL